MAIAGCQHRNADIFRLTDVATKSFVPSRDRTTLAKIWRPDEGEAELNVEASLRDGVIQQEDQLGEESPVSLGDESSQIVQAYKSSNPQTSEDGGVAVPILYNEKALGVIWTDSLGATEMDGQSEQDSLWHLAQEAALAIRAAQVTKDLETGDVDFSALLNVEE